MEEILIVGLILWAILSAASKSKKKGGKKKGAQKASGQAPARPVRPQATRPPSPAAPPAAEEGGIPMDDPFGQMMMEAIREARRQSEATPAEGARAVGGEGSRSMGGEGSPAPRPPRPQEPPPRPSPERPYPESDSSGAAHTAVPGLCLTFDGDEVLKGVVYSEILRRRPLRRYS